VLSLRWDPEKKWTDADEFLTNQLTMVRQTSGLLRRCRQKVYLCSSGINEQGNEQRGPLLQAVQYLLYQIPDLLEDHSV